MTYLLDSSALVAHALNAPGAAEVQSLIEDDSHDILFSALSLFELAGVLKMHGAANKIPAYWAAYRACAEVVSTDAALAQSAWELRESTDRRIPIADAIIAATSLARRATLVHRDQHLAAIPTTLIPQFVLPAE